MTAQVFYALLGSVFGFSYEYYENRVYHAGQDYPHGANTPIPSPGVGVVVESGYTAQAGYYVAVRYATPYGELYLVFYHMIRATHLALYRWVGLNDVVGYVGVSGNVTGYHLHLAVSTSPTPGEGQRRNPVPVIAAMLAAITPAATTTTPIEKDDMYNDTDRARDNASAARTLAIYDAVFKQTPTTLGNRAGILITLKALDNALFLTTPTSFGTPGGALKTLKTISDKLDTLHPATPDKESNSNG